MRPVTKACLFAFVAAPLALAAPSALADDFNPQFDPSAPAAFQFGESVEAHATTFESHCTSADVRELDPAENPMAQETLTQVDCQGFDYFGAPRLAEFVFADGALTHVWVLTTAEDNAGLRAAFEASFGAPSHDLEMVTAFIDHNAAIRLDPHEALYTSDAAAPLFRGWFDQVAAQGAEQ